MTSRKPVQYPLRGDFYYMRRDRGSELLFAVAKYVSKREHLGHTLEGVMIYPAFKDWVAVVQMQDPTSEESRAA